MTELSFTPTFQHTDWVDNVDRIQAGGPNGFNVRLNAIEADLREMSTVVERIDDAIDDLDAGRAPSQQVRATVPVHLVTVGDPDPAFDPGWAYTSTGAVFPSIASTSASEAVMALSLPGGVRLTSFQVRGLRSGTDAVLTMSMSRVPFADPAQPTDVLGTLTVPGPGTTHPFDVTVSVAPSFAVVNNGIFRYAFLIKRTGPLGEFPLIGLDSLQVAYTT